MTNTERIDPEAGRRRGARAAFLGGLVAVVAITLVDLLIGRPILVGLLAIPPFLTVPRGERRDTILIAVLGFAIAVASPLWDPTTTHNLVSRLLIVGLSGVAAVWAITARNHGQREQTTLAEENARLHAESERARTQLDALVDNAPVGVAFLDPDGRFRRVNRTYVAIKGGVAEDYIGRTLREAVPHAAEISHRAIAETLRTGLPQIDVEVVEPGPGGIGQRSFIGSYYRIDGPEEILGVGIVAQDQTDRERIRVETERQRNLYETLLRTQSEAGEGVALLDGESVAYVNAAATEIVGYSVEELRTMTTYLEVLPEAERDRVAAWMAGVITQDARTEATIETVLLHKDGHPVDVEVSAQPVAARSKALADLASVVIIGREISGRKQAERERIELLAAEQSARRRLEASHRRMSLLARAGAILERSLDLGETLPLVAELVLGELADSCVIEVRRPGQRAERIVRERPAAAGQREGSRVVVLPLLAGDAQVGSFSVGRRTLGEEDDQLLRELARRVALAVANAHLYAERDDVAATLQRSLLPPDLPALEGHEIAAAFRPAGAGNEVGGDFYDVFAIAPGQWGIVIGDVCGKGADAAAVTALARYSIRTITAHETEPSTVLGELNETLLRHGDRQRFCTAIYASLHTGTPSRPAALRVASGGHLPPVVIRRGHAVELTHIRGTLLGVVPDPPTPGHNIALDVGDTLVLYTDGVVEARTADGAAIGTEGALAALTETADAPPQTIADHLADLAQDVPGGQRDDIAVLVLRRTA